MRQSDADASQFFMPTFDEPEGPPLTLSGREASYILAALAEADRALQAAEGSKLRRVREAARSSRIGIGSAWAMLGDAGSRAARQRDA